MNIWVKLINMIVLGIETSCDETAAAVVESGINILSNVVASSKELHIKTGGIIPEQAAREQLKSIILVIETALKDANTNLRTIDAVAVTYGPGLIGSLLVGVETAKSLSYIFNKPIIPVNHLAAHIYANFILKDQKGKTINPKQPQFPALALVVSGGHTDLVLMKDHPSASSGQVNIKWIGGTRDDAAGEAFDKTARLLGLPYPGGPAISAEATKYEILNTKYKLKMFPRPMINEDNFDWSFSGLKTSVFRKVKGQERKRVKEKLSIPRFSAEIQEAIVDVLVEKTLRAVKKYKPRSLLLAGGVAANKRLREEFKLAIGHLSFDIGFYVPPPYLCTDNAAYIASYAFFNQSPIPWYKVDTNPQLTITGEY